MPNAPETESDDPAGLRDLSDREKADVIAASLMSFTGAKLDVAIQSMHYRGQLGRRGPFKQPTSIEFEIFPGNKQQDPHECIRALQETSENRLAESIANGFGRRTGEAYAAELTSKRVHEPRLVGKQRRDNPVVRMGILIARVSR